MYADEHPIVSSDSSIDKVAERLQQNGNKMTDWYEENLLKVNIKKYQLIALGSFKNAYEWICVLVETESLNNLII